MQDLLDHALGIFLDECNPKLFKPGKPALGDPPQKPGLYRLIRSDTGIIWYVGQTSNLKKRIAEHANDFPGIEWVAAWKVIETCFTKEAYDLLKEMEKKQIEKHSPEGNQKGGGAGEAATNGEV